MLMSDKKEKVKRATVCHGDLCFDPKIGKLVFEIGKCDREIADRLADQTPMIIRQKAPKEE